MSDEIKIHCPKCGNFDTAELAWEEGYYCCQCPTTFAVGKGKDAFVSATARADYWRNELNKRDEQIYELRRIAAHVPGAIYIKAKEDAGYGEAVRVKEERGEK